MYVPHVRNPGLSAHLREDEKRRLTYSDLLLQLVQVLLILLLGELSTDNKFLVFYVIEEVKVVN